MGNVCLCLQGCKHKEPCDITRIPMQLAKEFVSDIQKLDSIQSDGELSMKLVSSSIPHISEHDPEDIELDPSFNPNLETFICRFSNIEFVFTSYIDFYKCVKKCGLSLVNGDLVQHDVGKRLLDREKQPILRHLNSLQFRRYNSTSTLLLKDSTPWCASPRYTFPVMAAVIYAQIQRNTERKTRPADIFDESYLTVNHVNILQSSTNLRSVSRFINTLFRITELSSEYAIVAMIYLERIQQKAQIYLTPNNWKRIVLCCVLLASKVWDDQSVWNVDYCNIHRKLDVNDLNELERRFLCLIQFNVNVSLSVFTKYYFDVSQLYNPEEQPIPLSKDRAIQLEAISHIINNPMHEMVPKYIRMKRCGSVDTLTTASCFRSAIIS